MKNPKIFLFVVFLFSISQIVNSQSIYQWRGANRDGKYTEKNLLSQWPENGPELSWHYDNLGAGFASPCVTGEKLFINGVVGTDSYLFAFDLKGKLLWKFPNGKEFTGSGYASNFPGARSTPTVVNDLVYATTGLGRIACFETATGKEKWAVEMVGGLLGYLNEFGYAESLLVDENKIYCFPGGAKNNMAALDRFTGKTIWISKATGDTTHFVSPILIHLPARKILVTVSRHYLFGVDCNNGELLWKYKIAYKYDGDHCNTPVYNAPFIYFASGDENGNGAVKLHLSADGKSVKEIWSNKQMRNSMGGFIVHGKKMFITTENKNLNVLKLENGTVADKIKAPYGNIIFADNKFICYGNNGDVSLFNYENEKLTPGGTFKIKMGSKEHFSHPVMANGILYIRHGTALMAYKIQ